ncbi:MAG: M23 family metallopeptidase [Patescibacteria group bacterium]|nr:M23 family metallopeptidase [Patescibacteria group bacterium]MDE1945651.1 M23 family metallopeptidase [Patescibacteria group bacterium]
MCLLLVMASVLSTGCGQVLRLTTASSFSSGMWSSSSVDTQWTDGDNSGEDFVGREIGPGKTRMVVIRKRNGHIISPRPIRTVRGTPVVVVIRSTDRSSVIRTPFMTFVRPVPGWLTNGLHSGNGVDFHAPYGTPVIATAKGKVVKVSWNSLSGLFVKIDHRNGIKTKYCHLSAVSVHEGEFVAQGQQIGSSGNTGYCEMGAAHLHFGVEGMRNPYEDEWEHLHPLSQYAKQW